MPKQDFTVRQNSDVAHGALRLFRYMFFGAVVAVFLTVVAPFCTVEAALQSEADWWVNDVIYAEGQGLPPERAKTRLQARVFAKKAAELDAYRNLAVKAAGIQVTANAYFSAGKVEAFIKGAETIKEEYDDDNVCTVTVAVPLYGVTNSVAKEVFKPVKKNAFPMPSSYGVTEPTVGDYTGLIIDCSDAAADDDGELNPVLTPIIKNAGNETVYGYNNLDYNTVLENGMIGYAAGMKGNLQRVGNNPLIIKASELTNDGSTPVLTKIDSDRILRENMASHFLDRGAVMFVSHRIRGFNDNYDGSAGSGDV